MNKTIEIPEGYEAKIEGNKVILEPKESKDERIRKAIINVFSSHKDYEVYYGASVEDILAWLEKQGEQNPKSADFIPTDCTSDAKNENRWHKVEDSLPDNNREVLCKDAIGNFFIGRYYNDGDYWEVSMYDEPDKSNEDNPPVIMWANIPSCEQNLANSAKTCKIEPKFKVGDVIHNKWSNQTKTIIAIDNSQYTLDDGMSAQPFKVNINVQDNWELVEENPVWSEEDEKYINGILMVLESWDRYHVSSAGLPSLIPQYISWLKFLKDRYTWKPTVEQLIYLKAAFDGYDFCDSERGALESLYNDLNKLKV